jgi:glucokinase
MLVEQTPTQIEPMSFAVGVDIGGTHITAAVVDLDNRTLVPGTELRAHVNAQGTTTEILKIWFEIIEKTTQKISGSLKGVGFAMPGPFDYQEGISLIKNMHKYDALYGLNIKELLAQCLSIPVSLIQMRNDAEAFMAGEVMGGAARGANHAVGITLGTGLGSAKSHFGITEDVNRGSSPFKDGIAEDYISTRWFVKRYWELTGQSIPGVKELLDRGVDDPIVQQILNEFCTNLAPFLQTFIREERAELVVVGGSIAQAYRLFYPQLRQLLPKEQETVLVKKAILGETAALIGAVSCWMKSGRLEVV